MTSPKYMHACMMDARFKCPFNMQIVGPSQSGKTIWARQLLNYQEDLLEVPVKKVDWYSPHNIAPPLPFITMHQNLPWHEEEEGDEAEDNDGQHRLIVLDDFGMECRNSKELTNYFTRHSHHKNVSIIQIIQNLFWSGSEGRTRSLNTHYIVLMRQSRDQLQIRTLARQISQNSHRFNGFMEAYNAATSEKCYTYLMVSLHPRDHNDLLLRSHIFPEESTTTSVYLLRKRI